jgi:hypothetical protein
MFKSRRMRWAGHVVCSVREKKNVCSVSLWVCLKERDRFEDLGRDGKVILKWILEKLKRRSRAGCM